MELKNQVVSLEIAKKLKKLGMGQKSYFYWRVMKEKAKSVYAQTTPPIALLDQSYGSSDNKVFDWYAAFTVAELGELLPVKIQTANKGIFSGLLEYRSDREDKEGRRWRVIYEDVYFEYANSEANARGKMLVYLLKNNLLTLPE